MRNTEQDYGINQYLASKWLKNKCSIIESSARKNQQFFQITRATKKYTDLFQTLLQKFLEV